jgi:hypothetical protein
LQLFSQLSFVTVAVFILCGLSVPVLHALSAAKSLRGRSRGVDLQEDALLGIEEAITLIHAEQQARKSQNEWVDAARAEAYRQP